LASWDMVQARFKPRGAVPWEIFLWL
jgi:hypothetical protein